MRISKSAMLAAALLATTTAPALAEQQRVTPVQAETDTLKELERKADELSDVARETIEDFIKIIGPMIERFSVMINDLPAYHAPEILPNGDIIMRRKHDNDLPDLPGQRPSKKADDATET